MAGVLVSIRGVFVTTAGEVLWGNEVPLRETGDIGSVAGSGEMGGVDGMVVG